jgi:hypothetical protein
MNNIDKFRNSRYACLMKGKTDSPRAPIAFPAGTFVAPKPKNETQLQKVAQRRRQATEIIGWRKLARAS